MMFINNLTTTWEKNQTGLLPPIIHSKWIRHFSVRPEVTKFLGKNSQYVFDISLSNSFLGCISLGKGNKVKINKRNYINLKSFQTKAFL